MSIDSDIKKLTAAVLRIAEYVDRIESEKTGSGSQAQQLVSEAPAVAAAQTDQLAAQQIPQQPVQPPVQQIPQQPVQPPVQQQPAVATQPLQQQVQPQPGGQVMLDDDSINQFLIGEAARIGPTGGPKIIAVLGQFGANRVTDVPEVNRPQLIAAVQALV